MSSHKLATMIAAILFLILAAASLYRLLIGFPISIGGYEIGQTMSFFAFVICTALSLMLFRGGKARG